MADLGCHRRTPSKPTEGDRRERGFQNAVDLWDEQKCGLPANSLEPWTPASGLGSVVGTELVGKDARMMESAKKIRWWYSVDTGVRITGLVTWDGGKAGNCGCCWISSIPNHALSTM